MIMKTSMMTLMYSFFIAFGTYTITKTSRPPNEFFYMDSKARGAEREVLNMQQIIRMDPTWDTNIPVNKRTDKNAKWTMIKLTDNSVVIIKEELEDVLNRMRNAQQ